MESTAFPTQMQATANSLQALHSTDQPQAESGNEQADKPVGQQTRWSTRRKLLIAGCVILVLAVSITVPLLISPTSSSSSAEAAGSSCNPTSGTCSCVEGSFAAGGSLCKAWSQCQQGELITTQGTATSDRVCGPCTTGTFQDASNHASTTCQSWSQCQQGELMTTQGTATSDRVCGPCTTGTFQDVSNHTSTTCQPWTPCIVTEVIAVGNSTSDLVCEMCVYQDSSSADPVPCRVCTAGTYLWRLSTATSDRGCTSCNSSDFQSTVTHLERSCTPRTRCRGGQYAAEGNRTADTVCQTCPIGMNPLFGFLV